MIKSVTVTNYLDESITLELARPDLSGIIVRNIEGIGAGLADINLSDIATGDGALYNSARVNSRNIVFDLAFLFQPTVEDVRQKTYKYFPIKKRVKLTFQTTNRTVYIYGYVESNEPDIFQEEESTSISILCPDPYFYSEAVHDTIFSGVESLFEFPFSNESLSTNLIEISALRLEQEQTVHYTGDAEVGIVIYIHAIGNASGVKIYNAETRESMFINSAKLIALTGSDIKNGDDITISTIRGQKYATLLRSGVLTNILNCLEKGTDWFQLVKGDNILLYTATSGDVNLQFRVENRIMYEGV